MSHKIKKQKTVYEQQKKNQPQTNAMYVRHPCKQNNDNLNGRKWE